MDNHENNRKKVCILCLSNNKNVRPITGAIRDVIRDDYLSDVDVREWYYPSSMCATCRISCSSTTGSSRKVVPMHRYKYDHCVSTRTNAKCSCEVCKAANMRFGKNLPGTVPKKVKVGRPKTSSSSTSKVVRMCNTCLTEIGRGKNHVCTSTKRTENLAGILKEKNSPPKASDAAVSNFLAEKASTSESENIRLSNRRGKPSVFRKINSTTPLNEKNRMRTEDIFKVKTENNLSMRKTLGIMQSLKRGGMRFETGTKEKLTKLNSQLQDLFSTAELGEVAKAENVRLAQSNDVPVVYCNNVPELIERIKKGRQSGDDELFIKLGIDGGGGFLKITLSVVSKIPNNSTDSFKDSGVKRLHILALAPNLPEKYEHIFLIWNVLLKLNKLDSIVAGDLKIINVIIGIMAHSSTHPCPYCEIEKVNLALRGVPRTVGNIRENCHKDPESKNRKKYASCVKPPLVYGQDNSPILLICPPPPLHVTLGIVNTVFKAVEKLSPDWADLWINKSHVRHQQRTYGFTGRACHRLLESVDILRENEDLLRYVDVLKHFQNVYKKCFSFNLEPGYEKDIDSFVESWEDLQLPKTSKYHITKFHVTEFCEASGHGLGWHNEQASESVHNDFLSTWERYQTTTTSTLYKSQLQRAVIDYNSGHLG